MLWWSRCHCVCVFVDQKFLDISRHCDSLAAKVQRLIGELSEAIAARGTQLADGACHIGRHSSLLVAFNLQLLVLSSANDCSTDACGFHPISLCGTTEESRAESRASSPLLSFYDGSPQSTPSPRDHDDNPGDGESKTQGGYHDEVFSGSQAPLLKCTWRV